MANFHFALQRQAADYEEVVPNNWLVAFQKLMDYLETIEGERKKIVFFDELPWFDTLQSDFMMALEHFWNSWATNRKDIVLITSGSAASWMMNKLINNHGGLHNRVTERIKIFPFNLQETEQLLKAKNNVLDRYQILQLYMVMGGIPYYLDAVSPDKSAAQNIEEMCFRKGALLAIEFKNLFASLFKNAEKYEKIVIALSTKKKGITRRELMKLTGIKSGGTLSQQLGNLEESGFITSYTSFDKKSRQTLYRLSDFYCLFYLKFIRNNRNYDEGIWVNAIDSALQRTWAGYAYEQVCLAHIPQIKKALGITGIISYAASWRSNTAEKGAQVDLLIDRRDQVINLCEVKYSINPFTTTKAYADNLRNKIGVFRAKTKTRKSIFLTMITAFGVERNKHSVALVQNELTMDDLFG